jgi:hypothetical protein
MTVITCLELAELGDRVCGDKDIHGPELNTWIGFVLLVFAVEFLTHNSVW